ncbi:MAG: hypothetical protein ACODAC_00050 [Pseudomonadota bacterium]
MIMRRFGRTLLWACLLGAVAAPTYAAPEDDPAATEMAADLLIARPAGVVVTTLGAVAFVASLPFSAAGGNVDQAAETLVAGPARETFVRCLGCRSAGRHHDPREPY